MDIFCNEVKPFVNPNIREVAFWLRIMKEHSLFIKLGLPCDQERLITEAEKFYNLFADLEKRVHGECQAGFERFIDTVTTAVKNIFAFKRHILHLYIECKLRGGANYPLLLDHISREALYFLKLLEKMRCGDMEYPVDAIVSENVFWLRIMSDHAKFIRGLLDPSERELFAQADSFSTEFDQLHLHARDIESMLWHFKPTNDLLRFEDTVTDATMRIRDFKEAARDLLENCAALALIPPLLADHVRREAEHFLEILEMIKFEIGTNHNRIITCE